MASLFPDDRLPPAAGGMVGRIKRIITEPKLEWDRIDAEPMTTRGIFTGWAVPLAAIGPVALFIGLVVFGLNLIFVRIYPGVTYALVQSVLTYLGSLGAVAALAFIIDALAPTFGATKNPVQAMKVAAFSMTAAWIAGIFNIIPALGIIAALLSIYSFYLLWIGLPKLMKVPADKAVGYTAATVVVGVIAAIIIRFVVGAIMSAAMPLSAYGPAAGTMTLGSANSPDGTASVDLGKLNAAAQQLAAAGEQAGKAASDAGGGGSTANGKIVAPAVLQALLPGSVGGFARTSIESSGGAAAGIGGANAKATYSQGDQSFTLSVTDAGALGSLATLGGALNMQSSKQTADGYEKTEMQGGRMVNEEWSNGDHRGKFGTMVASRFMVEAEGNAPSIDALKGAVAAVDLGKLEALTK